MPDPLGPAKTLSLFLLLPDIYYSSFFQFCFGENTRLSCFYGDYFLLSIWVGSDDFSMLQERVRDIQRLTYTQCIRDSILHDLLK